MRFPEIGRRAIGQVLFSTLLLLGKENQTQAADKLTTIAVFGDSQAQGLAGGFQRQYRGDKQYRVLDRSKISTGLIPRANYNWPAQSHVLAAEHPSTAVAMFGANDRPPVHVDGRIEPTLLERFKASYGARVNEVAAAFRDAGVVLVWVGHPIVRDPVFTEDLEIVNDIFAEQVTACGGTFVSTWEVFKGPDGNYSQYGKGLDGLTTRLRADDGVHMTAAGYDVLAAQVTPDLERQ